MRAPSSSPRSSPPRWAEYALRRLLQPRNRETVSGDLLEQYREVVLPARGGLRARRWYLRQVLSFVTPVALLRALTGLQREDDMDDRKSRASLAWIAAGLFALALLLGSLVRSSFGPPVGLAVMVPIATALAVAGLASVRSRADIGTFLRAGLVGGALLAAMLIVRLLVDVIEPVDPLERLLASVRDDYSEFDYPRRWLSGTGVAIVFIGAGFWTARQTGRVGRGTLAAITASVSGSLVYIALVALGNALYVGARDPLGNAPTDLQFFGNVPAALTPVLVMFSTVLGTVGAMFGRGLWPGGRSSRA